MSAIHQVNITSWTPATPADQGASLARELESGRVLLFSDLKFPFADNESRFLDPKWSNGAVRSIFRILSSIRFRIS